MEMITTSSWRKKGTEQSDLIIRSLPKEKKILIKAGLMLLRSYFKLSFLMCLTTPPASRNRGEEAEEREPTGDAGRH